MKKTQPTAPKKNAAAQALGRLGGQANTKAQQRARKRNAQLAGRPGRVCRHCRQPVLGGHVDRALDETCGRHGWEWQRAGTKHPAPPSQMTHLLREAYEHFTLPESAVDLKDWCREARKVLGLK